MNYADSLANIKFPQEPQPRIRLPELLDRAKEIVHEAALEYRLIKSQLKPNQTINLICTVAGVEYDVYRFGGRNGIVEIDTQTADSAIRIKCPVEQVSFAIIISKKVSGEPPREIGFHAMMETGQEKSTKA
jgi:hypothetical protein